MREEFSSRNGIAPTVLTECRQERFAGGTVKTERGVPDANEMSVGEAKPVPYGVFLSRGNRFTATSVACSDSSPASSGAENEAVCRICMPSAPFSG